MAVKTPDENEKVPSAEPFDDVPQNKKEEERNVKNELDSQSEMRGNFKTEILAKYIYPNSEEVIKTLLEDKVFYENLLPVIRAFKILFSSMLVPVLVLSDTQFPGRFLSYIAAIFSFSVALFEAADITIVRSNKKRIEKINTVLESIGIRYRVPDTILDDAVNSQLKQDTTTTNATGAANK